MRPHQRHLIIFAKAPRLGRVKSRLARDLGWVGATVAYRRMMTTTIRRLACDPRWTVWLFAAPDTARRSEFDLPPSVAFKTQGTGDLGARMARALQAVPPGLAVLIGTDIPAIRPGHIKDAFDLLGNGDAVFGPATDGGYWLTGFRRRPLAKTAFLNVRWSSTNALRDTLVNLLGRRVQLAARLSDIDDATTFAANQKTS